MNLKIIRVSTNNIIRGFFALYCPERNNNKFIRFDYISIPLSKLYPLNSQKINTYIKINNKKVLKIIFSKRKKEMKKLNE